MCGILSVVSLKRNISGINLINASAIIKHRGPDDEGFLTWLPGEGPMVWAGDDTCEATHKYWKYPAIKPDTAFKVGFGHRRLSILDLSPAGHQPMVYGKAGLSLVFNGEIYNYLEIKSELEQAGHIFNTTCDTEVILHAWEQWGVKCMDKFNGMFAFVILDHHKKELYAVRDRFGVKPLYYYHGANALYLASEIKQIKTSPDYTFELNGSIAGRFLASGVSDHTTETFDTKIKQVSPGHYLFIDLAGNESVPRTEKWYSLTPKRWKGSHADAAQQLRELLTDAIRLRLRSDVKVGSCLSGGLDSSSIVCIAAELLKASGDFAGQETVTACFENAKYDEWKFAQEVIKKTNAHPHRVFPSFGNLQEEIGGFLWHQDEPVGSTSVFSQWMVFKRSHEAGLKVMIDGQGADEQLAGYNGNDLPLYAGLIRKGRFMAVLDEAQHYKKEKGVWPRGFLIAAVQLNMGERVSSLLPQKLRITKKNVVEWLHHADIGNVYGLPAKTLQEGLIRQIYSEPLPALLRYEDHNSMAWSVESRTPFMDYRLVEFNLGLPERFIYKRRTRKLVLRDAMHNILPAAIENRKDKMGFVTPEEVWLKGEGREWFLDGIEKACIQFDGHLLNAHEVRRYVAAIIAGKREFDFVPWRIFCFHRWYNQM